MAELPGWDRGRLATAAPADVEAARWLVYARARAPEIRRDLAGDIEALELGGRELTALQQRQLRGRAIEELRAAQRAQAELRVVLELDDDGEDD